MSATPTARVVTRAIQAIQFDQFGVGPEAGTNWEAAFRAVVPVPNLDLAVIVTDGRPNRYATAIDSLLASGPADVDPLALDAAVAVADQLRGRGTRLVAVGIGDVRVDALQAVCGPEQGRDWFVGDFEGLRTTLSEVSGRGVRQPGDRPGPARRGGARRPVGRAGRANGHRPAPRRAPTAWPPPTSGWRAGRLRDRRRRPAPDPSCGEVRQCTRPGQPELDIDQLPRGFGVDYEMVNPRRFLALPPPSSSGNLKFESSADGPRLGIRGRVDGFPSMEVYQDLPAGDTVCLYRQDEETVLSLFGPRGEKEVRTGKGC